MATKRKAPSGKRELIKPKGDARYVRRDEKGRIKESDDVGRSQKQDRARAAKTAVKSGQGDRGDQRPRAKSGPESKSSSRAKSGSRSKSK
jgi:hypothetical protein